MRLEYSGNITPENKAKIKNILSLSNETERRGEILVPGIIEFSYCQV